MGQSRPVIKRLAALMSIVLLISACGTEASDVGNMPDLPETDAESFTEHLASIDRPAVVNVWASWCIPCRSEAPLLDQAFEVHGDQVEFIGIDVQDNQNDAKAFLAEFGLEFDHFFDRGRSVPNHYAVIGTPVTLFFAPRGELVRTHQGVIDDRGLALGIDELLNG